MDKEPIFNAPASVVRCLAVLAAVHVVVWHLLPEKWSELLLQLLAFSPMRYATMPHGGLLEWGAPIWSLVTYQLLHGDLTHLLFNSAWLLIFGSAVARRIGGARFLAFTVLAGIAAAMMFLVFHFGQPVPVIGASGGVSGLLGGAFRFLFSGLDRGGFAMFQENPKAIPLMTVRETLSDRRFQAAAAVLVLINLLTVLGAPMLTSGDGVAWEAHLGGFLFGLLGFQLFEPPARKRPKLEIVRPTLH